MPEYELPEFTRSLRALAVPSTPGSDHDRVFTADGAVAYGLADRVLDSRE